MYKLLARKFFAAVVFLSMISCALAQSSGFNPSYPPRATAITASSSGADTSSASVSLAASPGQTTYICSFSVGGLGATAIGNVVVTVGALAGNVSVNYTYSMPAGATVPATPLNVAFTPCMPAVGQNSAITVTVPGAAGNTSTTITASGYQFPNP